MECGICGSNILLELLQQSLGTDPALQGLRCIGSVAQIQIPDAGFGFDLLEILSAISRKDKRDFICSPLVDGVLLMFIFDSFSILLALMVNDRGNVNSGFFSFHNAHKLHPDKQGVICVTILTYSGVSRPLSNGKISTLLRPGSLRIAQSIGVSLPTKLAKLFVNQVASLCLGKLHALRCGFAFLCTFLGGLGRCRGGYCLDLLGECNNLFLLLFNDGLIVRLHHIFRHDKRRGNISPVAIYFHEPNRKVIGHREQRFCILHRVCTRMDRIVSRFAKCIQDVVDFLGNQAFALQQANPVGVGVVDGRFLDMLKSKNLKNQPLTKHTQLIQAGVGIGVDIALRCRTDLCQRRPVSVEKFKVGFHVCPPNFSSAFDKLLLSEVGGQNQSRSSAKKSLSILLISYVASVDTPKSYSIINFASVVPSTSTTFVVCCFSAYWHASFVNLAVVMKSPLEAPCPASAPTNF